MGLSSLFVLILLSLLGFTLVWKIPYPRREDQPPSLPPGGISVIIPARNEEENLARLLPSLSEQGLKPIEVILIDDHSEDGTAAIGQREGCRVIPSLELPEGWAGKPWGCWQGANQARGDLFLFLDADTFLEKDGLEKLASTYLQGGGLLTVQPYHRMEKANERLSAIFNILVLAGMNAFTPWRGLAKPMGAFGPCNLCSRDDYFAVGGHERVKGEVLESLGLAKEFQKKNLPVRCYGGKGTISFRMYPGGVRSLIEGFSKGFGTGAKAMSPGILFMTVGWITGGVGVVRHVLHSFSLGDWSWLFQAGALYGLYAIQFHWMLRRMGNFGVLTALFFPVPLLFFVGVFALSFFRIFLMGKVRWKGREVRTRKKEG
ncbi:MAG: glycosyltransferase [Syntrophaceae bacterium]|nr:glycosyltransferase [Syntrophaceae bacterium]